MAVVIASDLAKDMAGEPLLRGVSFRLERRDRMTLSGRNGAGKTTLLRMLSGETSVDGGELSFAKDVRLALHDQRPPRDRDLSLRDYVLSGAKDLLDLETRLAELEHAMAEGAHDAATLDAYARAQARLEHAGGYTWRERINSTLHGLGFRDAHLDRSLETFSGGELTRASLARALAGDPDLLLLDEPTNHLDIESLEWLEAHLQSLDAAVVLVAHDRWFLEAVGTSVLELEAGRGRFFKGTWHAWRKEKAARELALGPGDREAGGRDRAARAVRRPLPGRHARAPGAVAREEAGEDRPGHARPPRRQGARLRLQAARAVGTRGLRGRGRDAEDRRAHAARRLRAVARARRARVADRPQRDRQDDADQGAGRAARARRRQAAARPQRQARAALPARRGARARRARARCWRRPSAPPASSPTRRARCSAASCSAARRPRSRSTGCPAASAAGSRWPSSSTPAPTCSCSTSRPTTSTSRAARRWRPRCRPSPARCC